MTNGILLQNSGNFDGVLYNTTIYDKKGTVLHKGKNG